MIEITAENKNKKTLWIRGHAGYDVKGKDIVCAGVSTLIQTLAGYTGAPLIKKDDVVMLSFTGCNVVYAAVMYGLKRIEKDYPEHVKIIEN